MKDPTIQEDPGDGSKESMSDVWGMIPMGFSRYQSLLSAPVKDNKISTVLVTPPLHTPFCNL